MNKELFFKTFCKWLIEQPFPVVMVVGKVFDKVPVYVSNAKQKISRTSTIPAGVCKQEGYGGMINITPR